MTESSILEDADSLYVSIPRGGPIYIPDMVGPLTRVPDFKSSVLHELEDLKETISAECLELSSDDISVDDLRIITEEELVNKAFEEAFRSQKDPSQFSVGNQNTRRKDANVIPSFNHVCLESSAGAVDDVVSHETSNVSSLRITNNAKLNNDHPKRKKRRVNQKDKALDETYLEKVQELAMIMQKQDEDKAQAALHSFSGGYKANQCSNISSEKSLRLTSLRSMSSSTKVRASNVEEHVPMHDSEVLLCIEVYHSRRPWIKTQEFMVLGQQYLTELRDKINCLTDQVMKKADRHDPSGYFLIEDVFYNDLRDLRAIDYSKPILDWLANSEKEALEKWECILSGELQQKQKSMLGGTTRPKLPEFKSFYMQKTHFCDLKLRLGAGYLYCHQGDCKHVIVFRDIRLIHPEDVQNRTAYPLVTFQLKPRISKCSVCKIQIAKKVTLDDKWAAENPCCFCDLCYYMLHYDQGKLLYDDFSVYDYHQDLLFS